MNCVVTFVDVKLKKNRFPRINFTTPHHQPYVVQILNPYRGTSLIRTSTPLEPYSRTMPRVLWWSSGGGGLFLMSKVHLYLYSNID